VLDQGFAYQADGAVYFDVSKSPAFGSISHYTHDQMVTFARERGGDVDNPAKRNPLDFVLWHPSAADEPSWDTLWGPGRPGWHIECSALALRELGTTIDLHGGGSDLIFPHHECERAQSEAATSVPFCRHWMHVAMVYKDGQKMSKSLGNLVFVDALRKEWDPRAIRLAIIEHHYRREWEWDDTLMPRNAARLAAWSAAAPMTDSGAMSHHMESGVIADVRAALDDDLDTPGAIAAIDAAAAQGWGVHDAASLLGVPL
jgi:L-cysteine:1D-myo-inositol 2-amino-2-deoxy-alpha-D-glucopyranoside ligase